MLQQNLSNRLAVLQPTVEQPAGASNNKQWHHSETRRRPDINNPTIVGYVVPYIYGRGKQNWLTVFNSKTWYNDDAVSSSKKTSMTFLWCSWHKISTWQASCFISALTAWFRWWPWPPTVMFPAALCTTTYQGALHCSKSTVFNKHDHGMIVN